MIDQFTTEEFTKALPSCNTNLGIIQGEVCFLVDPFPKMAFGVLVRSSIDSSGYAADTGEDSIRCLIWDKKNNRPVGNKSQRWVTRVNGWEVRLNNVLRKCANQVRHSTLCPNCKNQLVPFTTKNRESENLGRAFVSCPTQINGKSCYFKWIEDEEGNFIELEKPKAIEQPKVVKKKDKPDWVRALEDFVLELEECKSFDDLRNVQYTSKALSYLKETIRDFE